MENHNAKSKQTKGQIFLLVLAGALFLPACGKNSGSFNAVSGTAPTVLTTPTPTPTPAPAPSATETPSVEKTPPTTSAEPPSPNSSQQDEAFFLMLPSPSTLDEETPNQNQASFQRYEELKEQQKQPPTAEEAVKTYPLAWESKGNPERKKWSDYVAKVVDLQFANLDQATDANKFCPRYKELNIGRRKIFWAMLISEIAYHESSWEPTARSRESTMGIDGVTKEQVHSEGLMQLSYQDTQWSNYCRFDWTKDKSLGASDPKKTIFNPYLNLSCGIRILANQVARKKEIVLEKDVYWSVLRENGRYSRVTEMSRDIQNRLDFCR